MIADRKGRMLADVRRQCTDCRACDRRKLDVVLIALAEADNIVHVVGATHVKGSTFLVPVNHASLEFVWHEPYASQLRLICPEESHEESQ